MEEDYTDLIKSITSLPRISASDDFSDKVMTKVRSIRPTVLDRIRMILLRPRNAHVDVHGILSSPRTKTECSFCYILTAAFYLVMGLVLMSGFKAAANDLTLNQWIQTQPQFILASAVWLFGLGFMLLFDGRLAVLGAKGGTLLYILATLAYGFLFTASSSVPAKYMSIVLSTTATLMGLILYYNLSGFMKTRTKATGNHQRVLRNS
jgi:hypothetical protein